ncbi:MAG: hypothetical protein OK422_02915 [Thaumarchaeota archaeon]|nr:hypothetical protein [Nitrososphaerota archaeon]
MTRAAGSVFVAVGTTDGGFLLSSTSSRKSWTKSSSFLRGESVNNFAYSTEDDRIYAATLTEGVFVSKDLGKTWKSVSRGLNVRKTWTVAVDPKDPNVLYAGTHYGHLFRSTDAGEEWEEVTGLHTAPKRSEWGIDWAFGTTGLCIHTVRVDPKNGKRLYIIASGKGPYRSEDGGKSWSLLQDGVMQACPVGAGSQAPDIPSSKKARELREHLNTVHSCTHKLVISQTDTNKVYQQNHCGVYSSANGGKSWTDRSPANALRHGFPIALVEGGAEGLYVVPAFQGICKTHNSCIKKELAVYRSGDGGNTWEKLTDGLPKNVHTCVLRDGMSTDGLDQAGLYFGTTTGEVYSSSDGGDSWSSLAKGVGRVQGVVSFSPLR